MDDKGLHQIKGRAELAKQWRKALPEHKTLAERDIYIRILQATFRPVSLSLSNPCGRLIKEGKEAAIGGVKTLSKAIHSADTAYPADYYTPKGGNLKPEHRIQVELIKHALCNNLEFSGLFTGFEDIFDELRFVVDEMAAGNIRADIIALGRKFECYFPVFIELKVQRSLGRLVEQLRDAKDAAERAENDFLDLLGNVTGIEPKNIKMKDACSIMIWPDSKSGKESPKVAEVREKEGFITAVPIFDGASNCLLKVARR